MEHTERLGIIDLGSNSSRLSIYEITQDGVYRPLFEMKQNVRLAHQLKSSGVIDDAGMARAVACTKLFVRTGELHGVTRWVAVATAAVRQAANRDDVLRVIEQETSIAFRVLSGDEEGRYGFLGAINTLDVQDALIFDVGGASSEVMLVRNRRLKQVTSIPFGALTLQEMFSHLSESDAADAIYDHMLSAFKAIPWMKEGRGLPVVGLGGTARSLVKLHLAKQSTESDRLHGYILEPDFITASFGRLSRMSVEKRRKVKGISKSRAEILVAGFGAVKALVDIINPPYISISRNGLREGLLFEHLLPDDDGIVPNVLLHSVQNFQKVYGVNESVSLRVTEAALRIFDECKALHTLTDEDQKLLWVTGQVESCGCYINTEKWTKHSAYLVVSSFLYGLHYPQLEDVASLLYGRSQGRLQTIMVILRFAKLLVLQLGLDDFQIQVDENARRMYIGTNSDVQEIVNVSADGQIIDTLAQLFNCSIQFHVA